MISMKSRRNLFQGIFGLVANTKSENAPLEKDPTPIANAEEFVIGRLKDYPLGEKVMIVSRQIIVETLPEGIRVQSSSNPEIFFSVKLNTQGEITVNINKTWSADMFFSMMTNEPVRLNNNKEISV